MSEFYPIAIIEDRYEGTYSGGRWLAVGGFDVHAEAVWAGPHAGDVDAAWFWAKPPRWIAVVDTPNEALDNLLGKQP